jgi:hypothetical protein
MTSAAPVATTRPVPYLSATAPAIRLRDAPHQLRARERETDRGDAQAGRRVDRADEQGHRLAYPEHEREHEARCAHDPELPAAHRRSPFGMTIIIFLDKKISLPRGG